MSKRSKDLKVSSFSRFAPSVRNWTPLAYRNQLPIRTETFRVSLVTYQWCEVRDTAFVLARLDRTNDRYFELAVQSWSRRRIAAAIELTNRAEHAGHDPDACAALRWQCWMASGLFEEAWRESDRIHARGSRDPNRLWDGLPFDDKRVIIRCLHGYGDAIQFVRYAALVKRRAARVIVQTHPELVSLMRSLKAADEVITWMGHEGPKWDQQIEVMELPRAFRTTVETIPCEVPYLSVAADRQRCSRVRALKSGRPRIGLQWGSSNWDPGRSLGLSDLEPVLRFSGCEFFSFQRGDARRDLASCPMAGRIQDVSGESPDIVEAAADLMNIDLLVTVDTMLAHLAGALGRPVWVLLPYQADWRWMLERRDSPWYPSMRLFRQPAAGEWKPAVCRLVAEVAEFVDARRG